MSYRFTSLDGLRGIAAIAVMLFHAAPSTMPGGYLAVDFFFCLSGFIVAFAYRDRIKNGLALSEFAKLRMARLYPMMFLGGLLGIALHGGGPNMLFLVPDFGGGSLFPSNPPFWSLFAEVLVNIGYGIILVRLSSRHLFLLAAICGASLVLGMLNGPWPRQFGSNLESLPWMAPRTLYSFVAGVLLFRLRDQGSRVRPRSLWALLLPIVMIAAMMIDPAKRAMSDAGTILLVFPAIVWLGSFVEMPLQGFWKQMGALSYPLYCIHMPIIYFLSDSISERLIVAVVLVFAALALDNFYDRPLRAWLARRVRGSVEALSNGGLLHRP